MTTRRTLTLGCLALVIGGCASRSGPVEAPSAGVTTVDQRAMALRTQAAHLERSGHLRLALEAWTRALALAPSHEPSRRARQHLRERIDREVAELVRRGWTRTRGARGPRPDACSGRRSPSTPTRTPPRTRSAPSPPRPRPTSRRGSERSRVP